MKIAIAGFGVEGRSNYRYFAAQGHDITILDQRPAVADLPDGVPVCLGDEALARLDRFDMVVRSPSIAPAKLATAPKVWSATNEFFAHCPAPIIGVTGTKGKGTICSLVASMLRAAGRTVHLVGNIGAPALDSLAAIAPTDIVVYELSSFQLWDADYSPHIAVVTIIEPDHLDIHPSLGDYIAAKQHIVARQTKDDIVIFAAANAQAQVIAKQSLGAKIAIPAKESAHIIGDTFYYGAQPLCPVAALQLPGAHNRYNACAAIAAAWPYVQDGTCIERGLRAFIGLPHRLKFIRDVAGVHYYDDSIATTLGSAIAAINAFDSPKILILGGASKGVVDLAPLVDAAVQGNVTHAILIGQTAPQFADALASTSIAVHNLGAAPMSTIVDQAHRLAQPGSIVILTPASASFDMFKSYADRGDQFIAAVNSL